MASHTAMHFSLRFAFIFISISIDRALADFCQGYNDAITGDYIKGFYCPGLNDDYEQFKCCGASDGQYCCNLEHYNDYHGIFYWNAAKIVGVVLGALFGCVVIIIIFTALGCCYVKNLRRRQRQHQTTTYSGEELMSTRTTSTQRHDYPQKKQDYPQLGETYQPKTQSYPPTAYTPPQSYPQKPNPYPQGQSYTWQSRTQAANSYSPELAPPPPTEWL